MDTKHPVIPVATPDASYAYDQLIGSLEIAIEDRFGKGIFEGLIPWDETLDGLNNTLEEDEDDLDGRVSGRMVRLAFLNFLLVAYPDASIPQIIQRLPAPADLGSPALIVDRFADAIKDLAGLQNDPSEGWHVEPKAQRLIAKLLPVFFRSYTQMGQDEILTVDIALANSAESEMTCDPTFWREDESGVWNSRWGSFADDFRYMSLVVLRFAPLSQEQMSFAWIALMRLAAARPSMRLPAFSLLADIIATECRGPLPVAADVSASKLN